MIITIYRRKNMHLSLRNACKLKAKHEDIALMDKAAEGCLLFLSVFGKIGVFLAGDSGDSFFYAESITVDDSNEIKISDVGSVLGTADLPEFGTACESNRPGILKGAEGFDDGIIVPINNGRCEVIGFLLFSGAKAGAGCEEFTGSIANRAFRKKLEVLFQRLVPDALMFIDPAGTVREMNFIASEINNLPDNEFRDIFEYINIKSSKKVYLREIIEKGNCFCDCFTLDQFELITVFIPLYDDGLSPSGFLAIVSDVTLIGKKDKELVEKSAVIREIHHRVKNNLQTVSSLLRLQARRVKSPAVERVIFASINRILSIALIHDELSKDGLEKVNLKYAIKGIMEMVLNTMADPQKCIKGEIRGKDIILDANKASNLSLCITELVQNAIEHAFVYRNSGNISVTIDYGDSEAIVTVEDDGIGMLPGKHRGNTMGLNVIELIATDNLAGTFSIGGGGSGTRAEIRFPFKGRGELIKEGEEDNVTNESCFG